MANPEHLKLLKQGVERWNAWREKEPSVRPDLSGADLSGADLTSANLSGTDLTSADLTRANLTRVNIADKKLFKMDLLGANLSKVNSFRAKLRANPFRANLFQANLSKANLFQANLMGANLREANLSSAILVGAALVGADLTGAILIKANLMAAVLSLADLTGADLTGARLVAAQLIETNLVDATLTNCIIYGISAWNVKPNKHTKQHGLVITPHNEPKITVDDLKVAQFVYLLLNNENIRDVIDTVGKKGVLLLGRFTKGRIKVLERLREELRKRDYVPIVFNFDKPETKDFTETVRLLAGMSKFVIADITNPKSSPLELQATVPEIMVPFLPIMERGEKPFIMLEDLQRKYHWVFATLGYSSLDRLIETMDDKIIEPAEAKFKQLLARRAEPIAEREA
jgi:uncharacterized protein YjbI with pentapeptide repeats